MSDLMEMLPPPNDMPRTFTLDEPEIEVTNPLNLKPKRRKGLTGRGSTENTQK